ncbi:MAG: HAMP domain-containing histidine kinase [Gammaproteobacteria bacterium]|nr:HAMP domain-containing histidine kinase [Gammaproteobacteria bacterium]
MTFTIPDILIVEDEEFNRDIMARRLESTAHTLRFAVDGQQALDMVAEKKPDLVLLDIMLPEIMGLQVLHTLRQTYSMVELPIIMVTAIDEDQRIVRALELGANDYVAKPINFPILTARLQTQLSLKQLSALNTEFIATASHDLRKPLAVIQDVTAQALHKLTTGQDYNPQTALADLSLIKQSAHYMQNITECVLDMQASGFGQIRLTRSPVHLDQLINEAIERHRERANEKKISLISKYGPGQLIVEADKSRIAQVLDNCLGNAIKFCTAADIISVSARKMADHICVEISDTGPGLTDAELDKLFEQDIAAGNTADVAESSNGLSLPVCKQLIEKHDGRIGALNNKDRGATFWFSLPRFKLKPV